MRLEIISRQPAASHGSRESLHPTPLLFIHGMFHGAWCWDAHFLDYFAGHGFAAYVVSLRGHGNSEGGDTLRVKTPVLVLGAARDNMLQPREIEATARAYHTQAQIIPDVAHTSMLETRWETVAERILVWLQERAL